MNGISIIQAVILGAVQGATEFIPVSSSGHLVIAQDLLNVNMQGGSLLAFDVCLHFGTLIAVVAVFWNDIFSMIRAIFTRVPTLGDNLQFIEQTRSMRKLAFFIILGTIPAVLAAPIFSDLMDKLISSASMAALMLLVTGTFLLLTKFAKEKTGAKLGVGRTIIIGVAQAIAITPGISRSGATISAALFSGLERGQAARFSFLLSIPAILGAMVLSLDDLAKLNPSDTLSVVIGTFVAALSGFICIKWLLGVIKRGGFYAFGFYCWVAGLSVLLYKTFA